MEQRLYEHRELAKTYADRDALDGLDMEERLRVAERRRDDVQRTIGTKKLLADALRLPRKLDDLRQDELALAFHVAYAARAREILGIPEMGNT